MRGVADTTGASGLGDFDPAALRHAADALPRSRPRQLAYRLWRAWERVHTDHLLHLETVASGGTSIFRIRRNVYRGHDVALQDGLVLTDGMPVVDLHLMTDALLALQAGSAGHSAQRVAIAYRREMLRSLAILADYLDRMPAYRDVQAIYGMSLLYRGAERAGFTVWPIQNALSRRFLGLYLRAFLAVMHPDGLRRLGEGHGRLEPVQLAMSQRLLRERYHAPR